MARPMPRMTPSTASKDSALGVLDRLRLNPAIKAGHNAHRRIELNGATANRELARKKSNARQTLSELTDSSASPLNKGDLQLINQLSKAIETADQVEPHVLSNTPSVGKHLLKTARAARQISNSQARRAIESMIDCAIATFITTSIKAAIPDSINEVSNDLKKTHEGSKEARRLRASAFKDKFGINHMIQVAASSDGVDHLRSTLNLALQQWRGTLISRAATPSARIKRVEFIKRARRTTKFGHTIADKQALGIAMDFAIIATTYDKVLPGQGTHHATSVLNTVANDEARTASIGELSRVKRHGATLPAPHASPNAATARTPRPTRLSTRSELTP